MISEESLNDLEKAARNMLERRARRAPLMNPQDVLAFVAEVRRLRATLAEIHTHYAAAGEVCSVAFVLANRALR